MSKVERKIFVLDDQVVNQIAAGEVIERPFSVVKELVENAIDAGSTEISVLISNGGHSAIEVRDNGCGMTREDALVAIERFGTSKISSASDLESIRTLGFRGEAIPSIASVSEFSLRTCTGINDDRGTSIKINGGELVSTTDYPMPRGTHIEVNNLFFNVPARRKFLRSEGTETGAIRLLFQDIALAYPEICFRLYIDGKESSAYPTVECFKERVRDVYKQQPPVITAEADLRIQSGQVAIEAAICEPLDATSSAQRLRLIVNGRTVRDRVLLRAVRDAYGGYIKPGKYPWGVVKLILPAEEVDVNAHPQKAELRFRSPDRVFLFIKNALQSAISRFGSDKVSTFSVNETPSHSFYNYSGNTVPSIAPREGYEPLNQQYASIERQEQAHFFIAPQNASTATETVSALISYRFVGQVFKLFLIFEGDESLALVDMHAAHERVVFYRLKQQLKKRDMNSQVLLLPEVVDVPIEKAGTIEDYISYAKMFGFDVEEFGENKIIIRAVPTILARANPSDLMKELLSVSHSSEQVGILDEKVDAVLARLACHGSIRHGRELEPEEAYELIKQMIEVETSGYCPHGRPVVFYVSEKELGDMFGRS